LELTFQTVKLREICERRDTAASELGYAAARELSGRLADIEVLDSVADLCQLFGPLILDMSPTQKAIQLKAGWSVVFVSGHNLPPEVTLTATDWKKTSRMKITAIEATNG
jgi:hypothetical protein